MEKNNSMTYQLNPLINAQKEFNVIETRLFYLGLKEINPHLTENDVFFDKEFPDTHISPAELKEIFGNGKYLPEIKKACKHIVGTSIEINYKDGFDLYTVFRHLKYKENEGLRIQFNEDMRPFLLDIYKGYKKYGFTKIEMQQIFILGSAYAMRLLELLLQHSGKKDKGIINRTIKIDELRNRLAVPTGTYKQMCSFRHIVLDLPIEEIERKTPYRITYKTIKKGRSVVAFDFFCDCNNVKNDDDFKETIESQAKEVPEIEEMTPEEEKINKKLSHYGFPKSTIEALLNECAGDSEELAARLEYGEKRVKEDKEKGKEIPNLSGYLHNAIVQNWLKKKTDEEEEQEQELNAKRRENERQKAIIREEQNRQNEEYAQQKLTPFEISQIKEKIWNNEDIGDWARKRLKKFNLTLFDVMNM